MMGEAQENLTVGETDQQMLLLNQVVMGAMGGELHSYWTAVEHLA